MELYVTKIYIFLNFNLLENTDNIMAVLNIQNYEIYGLRFLKEHKQIKTIVF